MPHLIFISSLRGRREAKGSGRGSDQDAVCTYLELTKNKSSQYKKK